MASSQVVCDDAKMKHGAIENDGDERWAPVGFDDRYEVSTHGRMYNIKDNREVVPYYKQGYMSKNFGDKSVRVARLVLEVFDRPPVQGEQAIYLDTNPYNLHLSNLRWSSTGNPSRKPATRIPDAGWTFIDPSARVRSLGDIIDCNGGYVFSDGRVETPSGKKKQANHNLNDPRGYMRVTIVTNKEREEKRKIGKECKGKSFDIHRLVAMAFLPQPQFINPTVDHINGKKYDNRVENLAWVDNQDNNRRAHATGNIEAPHQKRVKLYEFEDNRNTYIFKKEYDNMTAAGKDNGFTQGAVKLSCNKKKENLPKARKHAKSPFFKTHVFRFSEDEL